MGPFLLALQFLTIIPMPNKLGNYNARVVLYFSLVGLVLGIILVGLNLLLSKLLLESFLINTLLVITLAVLTGGLHLDGLADTTDAFSSGKDKQGLLEIMREPHIGTMGVLALISVIMLKVGILSSLNLWTKNIALILMCVLSRWSLTLPLYLFSYARNEGKAKVFFGALSFPGFIAASIVTLLFAVLIWNWKGLTVFTAASIFSYFFGTYSNRKIGGITGDILGATVELNEVFILLVCLLIYKV